ncbi:MAG: C-type lectin domain-containing protein [Ruminococcus sp.]
MNSIKLIRSLGGILLCGLMMTGCGHRTSSKSEENTGYLSTDQTAANNEETDFRSNYELTEKWLTDGFYTWEENDASYDSKPYGDLIGEMEIDHQQILIFQVKFFYPDGTEVRLPTDYGTQGSLVQWDGNSYQIQENGDIVFDIFGGTNFGGGKAAAMGSEYRTWYFYGEGDYRLNDGTPVTKQSVSYLEQLNLSSPEKTDGSGNSTSETSENKETFQDHTYQYFDASMSWTDAENMCIEMGGHLASINSTAEQSFLMRLTDNVSTENIWIGGYYDTLTNQWKWTDNSDFSYTNWDVWYNADGEAISQPDNWSGDEYWIRYANQSIDFGDYYVNQGGWLDTANESDGAEGDAPLSTFGFICEWSD